ncbi:MAG: Protein translocase subunit SecD [uncultured Gemmatimonadetes bacterium]|uniref:Protein translocase subunit SecD n=1 Tax=uncultured Gemmatimonadota bacterium TaxID=203437 RepID=A0A6J4KDP7_9BACT|nr:MAG: Protein translocase subunit SecD [uncultured Gemmatimonadota bacterium]
MFQKLRARVGLIVLVSLASLFFLYRNYMRPAEAGGPPSRQAVTLGLDLQGGSYYALELDQTNQRMNSEQRADAIERALTVVRMRVDELGVAEPLVQKSGEDRIIVQLAGLKEGNRAKEVLQKTAFLEFQIVRPMTELQAVLPRMDQAVVRAFPAAGQGTAGSPAATNPVGGILQTAPKAGDSAKAAAPAATATPLTAKLTPGPQPGSLAVKRTDEAQVTRWLNSPEVQRVLPRGTTLLWGVPEAEENPEYRSLWFVENRAIMTGEHLENAIAQSDQFGRPVVVFELTSVAGRRFEKETGAHINEQMAIVLDDRVYTAPSIRGQIGRNGQIDMGSAKLEDASALALVLRAGALPAPLRVVEERSVGASLGQDSIRNGQIAGIVGVLIVIGMMLLFYKFSGLLAVAALGLYVLFVLGALAMLDATLTFPGIAGLILSIGMAVDANVLVYERIREELDAGRNVKAAVNEGFQNALSAIVDSNLTTLITAAILYYVGTGAVKGFAVTLAMGIVASMFTAIFVTRTLFLAYLQRRPAAQSLSI